MAQGKPAFEEFRIKLQHTLVSRALQTVQVGLIKSQIITDSNNTNISI
jgi:hypothetical protein